ncbi:MAG: hypothetical protein R2710_04365 [Acidimicrobiales bacterium]
MIEIRRDHDNELCGFVKPSDDVWLACTVFGAAIGRHAEQEQAIDQVLAEGLSSLTDHWSLTNTATGETELVRIQEANPTSVTVALGYYSLPGVPSVRIERQAIDAGEWRFER